MQFIENLLSDPDLWAKFILFKGPLLLVSIIAAFLLAALFVNALRAGKFVCDCPDCQTRIDLRR